MSVIIEIRKAMKISTCNRFSLILLLLANYLTLSYSQSLGVKVPKVKLSSGYDLPIVGFGTNFRIATEKISALLSALNIGYRALDSAYRYNEKAVGDALRKWFDQGGKREELFITSKLPPQGMRPSDVETYLKLSLKNLGLDYLDMYLIHMPFGFQKNESMNISIFKNRTCELDPKTDHVAIWKEMEKQVRKGRVRSIGLSNFNESQILNVYNHAEIKPSNLQVELTIYLQQEEIRKLCSKLNISVTSYSPLGSNDITHHKRSTTLPAPINHPLIEKISTKYGKTTAQILLRYNVQNGIIVIPKSRNPKRQKINLDVFDFELEDDDMKLLKKLDQRGKVRKFDFLSYIGVENHPEYPFTNRSKK